MEDGFAILLELGAFFSASLLCYRNWQSPQIASGRNVWLGIGLGMFSFFIGSCVYGIWELYFKLEPDVSPADFFYIAFYFSLGWGMILAVLPRRLNLELRQWFVVGGIALAGILLALTITFAPVPEETESASPPPVKVAADKTSTPSKKNQPAPKLEPEELEKIERPAWLGTMDKFLSQFSEPVNLFYVIADICLLIVATTLLLAFWGGRFSQSWRMIAAATFCLYIADMWGKYAYKFIPNYESGNLLEVFFVFSGVLFGLGAALEYDVSTSRHNRGRRRRGG
ncbi:hypothetical protein [Oscillatoria sp. FACHB-1406]|uniref:hypothetical protein n=1 Tax=Oscillatoria sp. FACHB-1406 TaxID=2692846 RepID=UPI00168A370D|nr:hypothetical protein [Oscillatoria sp. FACHB-1406]MBD2578780.1 hypothetical protein [Oscillatoria sp. FACHB-1406]